MGTERDFSRRVRDCLKKAGLACYPVETGETCGGFPDLVVMHEGGPSFVELKSRTGIPVMGIAGRKIEGPGQRSFARRLARQCSYEVAGTIAGRRSFLLVECMDGVALVAEEESGSALACYWESLPDGKDLGLALRAWGTSVEPAAELRGSDIGRCYEVCAAVYGVLTGLDVGLRGISEGETLDSRDKARQIARDICEIGWLGSLQSGGRNIGGKS